MEPDGEVQERFRLATAGDREAFAALVRQHQAMVFSIVTNFVRDPGAAEELAQEVFLELHLALPSLESPAHAMNWLRRVATYRSIDQGRKERHRRTLMLDEVQEPSLRENSGPGASDPFLSARLRRLTAALPERARAVVLLRYQEDMTPAEIAEALGMPLNSVKSHLHRSLTVMREKLERLRVRL